MLEERVFSTSFALLTSSSIALDKVELTELIEFVKVVDNEEIADVLLEVSVAMDSSNSSSLVVALLISSVNFELRVETDEFIDAVKLVDNEEIASFLS